MSAIDPTEGSRVTATFQDQEVTIRVPMRQALALMGTLKHQSKQPPDVSAFMDAAAKAMMRAADKNDRQTAQQQWLFDGIVASRESATTQVECPDCKDEWRYVGHDCPTCNGTGKVTADGR